MTTDSLAAPGDITSGSNPRDLLSLSTAGSLSHEFHSEQLSIVCCALAVLGAGCCAPVLLERFEKKTTPWTHISGGECGRSFVYLGEIALFADYMWIVLGLEQVLALWIIDLWGNCNKLVVFGKVGDERVVCTDISIKFADILSIIKEIVWK